METFLDCVGWDHIGPAAARANADFLTEYTTGVETPACVTKAHSGRAARTARDGLSALHVQYVFNVFGGRPKYTVYLVYLVQIH